MAVFFFDTNSVAKYYVTEQGSIWIRRIIDDESNTRLITAITQPELAAALSRMQRMSRFGKTFMRRSFTRFRSDIHSRFFLQHALDEPTLRFACDLALTYPLRGYDAVQVASALLAQRGMPQISITFVSSDRQLLTVAKGEGLAIEDPESHPNEAEQPE